MKKSFVLSAVRISLLSSAVFAALAGQPAAAAGSACKGLEQAACGGNAECRWQAGYARKDGAQVAAHCRALPKKKAVTEPAAAPTETAPAIAAPKVAPAPTAPVVAAPKAAPAVTAPVAH